MTSNSFKMNAKNIEPINKNRSLVEAKIEQLIENGRVEITSKKELKQFAIGSLISYMNTNDIFKSCGFLTKITDDYFIYVKPDFESKFKVRFAHVQKIWVGDVYHVKNDLISITKTITERPQSKFEVIINNVIVYYGKDKSDYRRFIHTQKYKIMLMWSKFFTNHS